MTDNGQGYGDEQHWLPSSIAWDPYRLTSERQRTTNDPFAKASTKHGEPAKGGPGRWRLGTKNSLWGAGEGSQFEPNDLRPTSSSDPGQGLMVRPELAS